MDTSDPDICFDKMGVCNHCIKFDTVTRNQWFPNDEGQRRWAEGVEKIKREGKDMEYDCILGLSGGLDSSYLALKLNEWALRPLVVHVDTGWNSALAVSNIEAIVKYCGYDLHTHVVDWEEMRKLQLAYLRAGLANQDVPQDHIIFASLYHFATSRKIRYVISGGNIATEGVFPNAWLGSAMDAINLRAVYRQCGDGQQLRKFKTISFFQYYYWYPFIKRMRTLRPLNFMPYDKKNVLEELECTVGYKAYPRKHGESLFTKFYQNYWLPVKFGYDKRRPHLSSLIVSGQLTRGQALEKLSEPLYESAELEIDISYFCKKMRLSRVQFDELMQAPTHSYSDFPNWDDRYHMLKRIQGTVEKFTGRHFRTYS